MLIRDLEYKTGLDRATIRFYEREGLVIPERKENGYRTYSQEDCDTLQKVKLLRQLGMSLEKIKSVQQGTGDLTAVLNEQISVLETKIQQMDRAKDICSEMRDAKVCYNTLDAAYYLERLNRPAPSAASWSTSSLKKEFKEPVKREYHPVRRFLARMLDNTLVICLIQFVLFVLLRIRNISDFWSTVVSMGVLFLMIPINATMLHFLGTTPGKWVMGIKIESENGGNLSYRDAFDREWMVLVQGMGLGIPIWETWKQLKSYLYYRNNANMEWDYRSEYIYMRWNASRKALFAGFLAAVMLISFVNAWDLTKPKYRGASLTIAEFAENYNYYLSLTQDSVLKSEKMQPDGTFYPALENMVTVNIGGEPAEPGKPYVFETRNGFVRKILYSNSWSDVFYMNPVAGRLDVVYAVLMSQQGMGIGDLKAFNELWEEMVSKETGKILYENIEISWDINAQNCKLFDGSYTAIDDTEDSCVSLDFEILIHEREK